MILSKDVIECQRTIFSGKDLVTHGPDRLKDVTPFGKKIESNCFNLLIEFILCCFFKGSLRKKYQENGMDDILMLKSENVHANLTKVTGTFSSL